MHVLFSVCFAMICVPIILDSVLNYWQCNVMNINKENRML